MNRRDTVLALLALASAPLGARAQPQRSGKPFRIGLFPDLLEARRKVFVNEMRILGWEEGQGFVILPLGLGFGQPIEPAAKRMVAEKPDLIIATTDAYAAAAHRLTKTIPIVMWVSGYPVESGLANSLARPGKNVTGNTVYAGTGVWGKLVQLLQDAKPGIKRIGVLFDYASPAFPRESIDPGLDEIRRAGRALGLTIQIVEVDSPDQLSGALAAIEAERPDALLVTSGFVLFPVRYRITQFAVTKRLPMITDARWLAVIDPQPLLSYGPLIEVLLRQTAYYVDRILKGAKTGDLPIQQPAKFELVLNMKTAKAIGLAVPQVFLLRADEVIR